MGNWRSASPARVGKGIRAICAYSAADHDALHRRHMNEKVEIGPSPGGGRTGTGVGLARQTYGPLIVNGAQFPSCPTLLKDIP